MEIQDAVCPSCGEVVELRHNGGQQGTNEFSSPWVFVEHRRDDRRGDAVYREPCPASNKNVTTASRSM